MEAAEDVIREIVRLLDEAERLSRMCRTMGALRRIEEAQELADTLEELLGDEHAVMLVLRNIDRAERKVYENLSRCRLKRGRWWW